MVTASDFSIKPKNGDKNEIAILNLSNGDVILGSCASYRVLRLS